jgi:hypothetical protein
MPESGDAMSNRCRLGIVMRVLGVLQSLPCSLMPCKVILLTLLLGDTIRVRGTVL